MPHKVEKTLAVFDVDETLFMYGREFYIRMMARAVKNGGYPLSAEEVFRIMDPYWGASHHKHIENLTGESTTDSDNARKMSSDYLRGVHRFYPQIVRPIEGSLRALEEVEENGQDMALATAAEPATLARILGKWGLGDKFKEAVTAYDLELDKCKPDPYSLNTIMERMGKTSEETVYVGDHANDIKMAQAANVDMVVVSTGGIDQTRAEELGVPRMNFIKDVSYLPRWLGRSSLQPVNLQ